MTVNTADFRDLARYRDHPGVVLVPSVREPRQSRLFRRVLPVAEQVIAASPGMFVAIDARGVIQSFRTP